MLRFFAMLGLVAMYAASLDMARNSWKNRISRRDLLKLTAASGVPLGLTPQISRAPRLSRSRPNILFLMADQHRGDCIGADGNTAIHTPNLDAIARDGALFSHAYTATPSCIPARASILTGLGPWKNGLLGMDGWPIPPAYPLELPRALREAGYHTVAIGKMEFGPLRSTTHGFDEMILDETADTFRNDYTSWFLTNAPNLSPLAIGLNWNAYDAKPYPFPERLHHTHWTGETAVRFLLTYNRTAPFFLKVSFIPSHSPYTPPARWFDRYLHANLPGAAAGNWDARYKPRSGPGSDIWHGDLGAAQVHRSRAGYYGSISFVDEAVGRILNALDDRGWLEQTLILYTSDHGDMLGDHYLWRKCQPYQSDVRVPMLLRWPKALIGSDRGRVLPELAALQDVLPTFLDAASTSSDVDGVSLLGLLDGRSAARHETVELEHDVCYSPSVHWNAVTDGHIKYVFHASNGWEQLFDLTRDPNEQSDLASLPGYEAVLRSWRKRMVDELAARGPAYVRHGQLVLRPQAMPISPHYPREKVLAFLASHGIRKYRY